MNISSNLRTMLESYYPSLTKSEKKVTEYLLAHYEDVIYLSVTELAELVGVGETTVFRFCKKMGFKGYPELKLVIAQEVAQVKERQTDKRGPSHFAEQIKANIVRKIDECYRTIDKEDLGKAVLALTQAKRIFFFGIGSSGITAMTAKERFMRIGVPCDTALDSHRQNMVASILDEKDVIVAFSLSGTTAEIVESVAIAKAGGVNIIGVTSYVKSTLAEQAKLVLKTAGKENLIEGGTLTSSISQLYIVDLLVTGVALQDKDKAQSMREKTGRSIIDKAD